MEIDKVSQTLLTTLMSRANSGDAWARQAADFFTERGLTHKYTNYVFEPALIRTDLMDKMVDKIIRGNDYKKILNIGCGFCSRYWRIGDNNPGIEMWVDSDKLPVLTLRNEFDPPKNKHIYLEWDMNEGLIELDYFDLVIAEGSLMYLDKEFAKAIISNCKHILFDVLGGARGIKLGTYQKWLYNPSEWWGFNIINDICYDSDPTSISRRDDRVIEIMT